MNSAFLRAVTEQFVANGYRVAAFAAVCSRDPSLMECVASISVKGVAQATVGAASKTVNIMLRNILSPCFLSRNKTTE
jgi:hypothetical protein